MKPARILLLVVAIIAGGLAAFLATRGIGPQQVAQTVQIKKEERAQILVAKDPIGVGQRLTPQDLQWQDWPAGAVRPEYVTIAEMPNAPQDLTGAVARYEFFVGEPIREVKLARAANGYLSAVLEKGMRGVSIGVSAVSGAGGFIVPNDRVDVILSRKTTSGVQSQAILTNVKILAIGTRLGEVGKTAGSPDPDNPQAQIFKDKNIATLELDPTQAETVINAAAAGSLSLVLRSVADFGAKADAADKNRSSSIRMVRFGQNSTVMSSGLGGTDEVASAEDGSLSDGGDVDYSDDVATPSVGANSGPDLSAGESIGPAAVPVQ